MTLSPRWTSPSALGLFFSPLEDFTLPQMAGAGRVAAARYSRAQSRPLRRPLSLAEENVARETCSFAIPGQYHQQSGVSQVRGLKVPSPSGDAVPGLIQLCIRHRSEDFEDLMVPVEACLHLHHSLANVFSFQVRHKNCGQS